MFLTPKRIIHSTENMFSPQKMLIENLLVLGLLCSLLIIHETKGNKLSKEEEMNFSKQYRLLQKPSIKMIQNEYGDVYDCVDFYKQPAFDHPQLKNHTFYPEMRPTSSPINAIPIGCQYKYNKILKGGGCPFGTVPIRRVSRDKFYEIYNFTQDYAKSNIQPTSGTNIAILQTNSDPSKVKYYGVGGAFNVYNLSIEQSQYSSGEFVIQNGDDRIKVGWTVNPKLNKDNLTRSFLYTDAGQSHCFNALCPGFVIVRKDVHIDAFFKSPSIRGEKPGFFDLHVYQDGESGNWWLKFCDINVGFWPKQIFTKLSKSATYIGVGGEAYGPTNRPLPPMGNGYYPVDNNMALSSFFSHLVYVDDNHRKIDHPQVEPYTNDPHYGINNVEDTGLFGHAILYGGINK